MCIRDRGVATAASLNVQGKLGVGVNNPIGDIQVYKSGISTVNIVGEEYAVLQLGQKDSIGIGASTAQFKFGETSQELDIINGDPGSINSVIHGGGSASQSRGAGISLYGNEVTNYWSRICNFKSRKPRHR